MTSKQESHVTDKIGGADSKQESGLCYKFADSNITVITKVLNFCSGFGALIDIAINCEQMWSQRSQKPSYCGKNHGRGLLFKTLVIV